MREPIRSMDLQKKKKKEKLGSNGNFNSVGRFDRDFTDSTIHWYLTSKADLNWMSTCLMFTCYCKFILYKYSNDKSIIHGLSNQCYCTIIVNLLTVNK